jgi:hypothetical protein
LYICVVNVALTQPAPICRASGSPGGIDSRDSAGVSIVENFAPEWLAQPQVRLADSATLRIGEHATDVNYIFSSVIAATRLSSGEIVVADGGTVDIRVFDAAGQYLRRIGRAGQGPGEYQRLSMMQRLPGDTLLIADNSSRRLTYLTPGGHVFRTVSPIAAIPFQRGRAGGGQLRGSVNVQVKGRFADGSYLGSSIAGNAFGPDVQTQVARSAMIIYRLDSSVSLADSIAVLGSQSTWIYVFPDGSLTSMLLPFGAVGSIAVTATGALLTSGDRAEIRELSARGTLNRIIRHCEAPRAVTSNDRGKHRDSVLATMAARNRARYEEIFAALPFPSSRPSYTHLAHDASGRVWARIFATSGEPNSWQLFSSSGRLLGSVTLPSGISPLEIGGDYLLAKYTDSDGVQSVRLYRLTGQAPAPDGPS